MDAFSQFDLFSSGKINARLSVDALNIRRLVGDTLAVIVQSMSTLTCGLVIAMIASWELSLIILVLIPIVGLQGYAQVMFLKGFSADAKVTCTMKFLVNIYILYFLLGY